MRDQAAGGARVREEHTRAQHSAWPPEVRIDTTGLTVEESLRLALPRLA